MENMPIALITFGDKSHFDLHDALATTPISFTLSCFNEQARNRGEFWKPIGYIPNLEFSSTVGGRKINNRPAWKVYRMNTSAYRWHWNL